jgi:glyoxylase-like metal-dependent hydrolase (beta-lactamase superfamily II)
MTSHAPPFPIWPSNIMGALHFNLAFDAQAGVPVSVAKDVWRMTAPNPGPMTFTGTNTYVIGSEELAIIDPGPDDGAHFSALMQLIGSRPVSHVLTTHHHSDHVDLAGRLADATGARWLRNIEDRTDFCGPDWSLEAFHTPGHTGDHICFAHAGSGILFTGDHVMGWSTTVILPPDGKMGDYMRSLELLLSRPERLYLPGHGGEIRNPKSFVRALKSHRKLRERAIFQRLRDGDRTIAEIVAALYRETHASLHGAAAMSVLAHLEDMIGRGLVRAEGAPSLEARYGLT